MRRCNSCPATGREGLLIEGLVDLFSLERTTSRDIRREGGEGEGSTIVRLAAGYKPCIEQVI